MRDGKHNQELRGAHGRAAAPGPRRLLLGLGLGLLFLLVFIVYLPALTAGYVWDDDKFLYDNPLITHDGLSKFWFTTQAPDYFPLTSSMMWVEWRVWGTNPAGYHFVNILLHAGGACLLWLMCRRLKLPGAWFAAAVFALHPVAVSSAAWITEGKNTLSFFLFALSLLLYLAYDDNRERPCYVYALLAFLFALLSKTSVVMLPVVILALLWYRHGRITLREIKSTLPFFGLSALFSAVTIWFQFNRSIGNEALPADSTATKVAGAGMAVWFYLGKLLAPMGVTAIYRRWELGAPGMIYFVPAALVILTCAVLWWLRGERGQDVDRSGRSAILYVGRGPLTAFVCFVALLFPILGFFAMYFTRYSQVADHWQYLAMIAALTFATSATVFAIGRLRAGRRVATAAGMVILVSFATMSFRHAQDFRSMDALWRENIRQNPECWLGYLNMGNSFLHAGRLSKGGQPLIPDALLTHAALDRLGVADFQLSLRFNLREKTKLSEAEAHIGVSMDMLGYEASETLEWFSRACDNNPTSWNYFNLGQTYLAAGMNGDAVACLTRAIELNDKDRRAYVGHGWAEPQAFRKFDCSALELRCRAYRSMHEYQQAIKDYQRLAALDPNNGLVKELDRLRAIDDGRNDNAGTRSN